MRLYSFVNGLYLSPIQHGIQTGHCAVDLVRKYTRLQRSKHTNMVNEWADIHKTFIILNAVNLAGLKNVERIVSETPLPFQTFHEDVDSLGGLLTCVSVVVPENIYTATAEKVFIDDVQWVLADGRVIRKDSVEDDGLTFEFVNLIRTSRMV